MHRICLCPASIAWIRKHLMKSARRTFTKMISKGSITRVSKKIRRKHRSAKQRAATRRLVAFNKRRRR